MTLNIVKRGNVPEPPYNTELVCFAPKLFPYVYAGMKLRFSKYWWNTPEDERDARRLMAEQGAMMLMGCGDQIVQAVDRVYRLIDSNENGTVYSATGQGTVEDPYIFSPSMPAVPQHPALYEAPGSRWRQEDVRDMLYNAITGAPAGDYINPRGTNPILEEILLSLSSMSEEEQTELLQQILLALGGVI